MDTTKYVNLAEDDLTTIAALRTDIKRIRQYRALMETKSGEKISMTKALHMVLDLADLVKNQVGLE